MYEYFKIWKKWNNFIGREKRENFTSARGYLPIIEINPKNPKGKRLLCACLFPSFWPLCLSQVCEQRERERVEKRKRPHANVPFGKLKCFIYALWSLVYENGAARRHRREGICLAPFARWWGLFGLGSSRAPVKRVIIFPPATFWRGSLQ